MKILLANIDFMYHINTQQPDQVLQVYQAKGEDRRNPLKKELNFRKRTIIEIGELQLYFACSGIFQFFALIFILKRSL
jgi:hypothetical protein